MLGGAWDDKKRAGVGIVTFTEASVLSASSLLFKTTNSTRARMPEVAAAKTMIESGRGLIETIKKMVATNLTPALNKLEREIRKIDTNIDGLEAHEKRMVSEALENLSQAKRCSDGVKMILNALADETIAVASQLKRNIGKVSEGMSADKIKSKLEKGANQMCHILKRSAVILKGAKKEYTSCHDAMDRIKSRLEAFLKQVINLKEGRDGRLQKWKDNTRAAVYGGLAATVLFPPLAIAAYATAAGVLESKIKRHEDALARLFQKCDKSANAARNLISETRKTKSFFETEQVLIQAWESKMSDMAVDFKDADEVVENVELFGSDEMDRMLNALITACANYKGH